MTNLQWKRAIALAAATLATNTLALAPIARADLTMGGHNVTDCTIRWAPGATLEGSISGQNCVDGFLAGTRMSNLRSHPISGNSSDRQLVSDGSVACYLYHVKGYDMDTVITQVERIDSSLIGGLSNGTDPAGTLAVLAITSLCAGEAPHR